MVLFKTKKGKLTACSEKASSPSLAIPSCAPQPTVYMSIHSGWRTARTRQAPQLTEFAGMGTIHALPVWLRSRAPPTATMKWKVVSGLTCHLVETGIRTKHYSLCFWCLCIIFQKIT